MAAKRIPQTGGAIAVAPSLRVDPGRCDVLRLMPILIPSSWQAVEQVGLMRRAENDPALK
jgi:hypothetical protein